MKARFLYIAMLAASVLTVGMTACSDNDDVYDAGLNVPEAQQKTPITIDADSQIVIGVGETASFNITGGGDGYKVVVENPKFVTAELSGNTVKLTGVEKGIGGVLISDAQGNYKHVTVKCQYFKMTLDKNDVTVGMKIGHTDGGKAKITVTGGNGGYTAVSADEEVARTSVNGNEITIQGLKEGQTTVKITDMMGLTQTVNVKVEVSSIGFTEDEKAEVLALTVNKQVFDGEEALYVDRLGDDTYIVEKTDDGYKLYSYCGTYGGTWANYAMTFKFKGDLSVGKKAGASYEYKGFYNTTYDGLDLEILKNDGSRIWGIISGIKDNYLHTGYFCMPLK